MMNNLVVIHIQLYNIEQALCVQRYCVEMKLWTRFMEPIRVHYTYYGIYTACREMADCANQRQSSTLLVIE